MSDLFRTRVLFIGGLALTLALALLVAAPALAQERGDDGNRPSKNGLVKGQIGGADVVVTYGRPKVKGRNIWGGLVPYGKVWRAGANEATTISFSKDVQVEGQAVPAGIYSLFIEPSEGSWTVILNKTANQWGAFNYDQSQDLLRVDVEPQSADHQEEMTISIEGDSVALHWEKMKGAFKVAG